MTATAEDVWDDRAGAREWLNKAHPELDYKTPLEAAATEAGVRRVEEEILNKLRHGIPG